MPLSDMASTGAMNPTEMAMACQSLSFPVLSDIGLPTLVPSQLVMTSR